MVFKFDPQGTLLALQSYFKGEEKRGFNNSIERQVLRLSLVLILEIHFDDNTLLFITLNVDYRTLSCNTVSLDCGVAVFLLKYRV